MVRITGQLRFVTDNPAQVSEVWMRAPKVRTHLGGVVTTGNDRFPVTGGEVSFTAVPGPAVLALISQGRAVDTIPILVGDGAEQTLRQVVEAAEVADEADKQTLERLASEVARIASAFRGTEQLEEWAESASSSADSATDSAAAAALSAGAAGTSASEAASSAGAAGTSASEAASSAGAAKTDAGKAATSASDASESAEAAKSDADRAEFAAEETIQQVEGDFATRNYVDARTDEIRWFRGHLSSEMHLDNYAGAQHRGTYTLSSSTGGNPLNTLGWVVQTYDSSSGRTRQTVTASSPTDGRAVYRIHSGGAWTEWRPETWHGLVLTSADHADNLTFPHAYAVNSSNMEGLPVASVGTLEVLPAGSGFSTIIQRFTPRPLTDGVWIRSLTSGTWTTWTLVPSLSAVESLIPDGPGSAGDGWRRGNLTSSHHLDDYVGAANQGVWGLTSAVDGNPLGTPGWVVQTYDSSSGRTRQTVTASSPTDGRAVYRIHSGGAWTEWRPDVAVGATLTSASSVSDANYPGIYPVGNSTVAGLPEQVLGSIATLPAGTATSHSVRLFLSSEDRPRLWAQRAGGEWTRIGGSGGSAEPGQDPEPITGGPITETTRVSSEIAGALSHDRMTMFNGVGGPLRQSRDQGKTWEIVHQFPGQSIELVEPLANGEILVATSGTVDGVPSTRRVYVSDGYDPADPSAAQWVHKLTGSSQFVKFVDWSISQHGPIIVLAEYGPKGGMVWGSGPEPIPEGKNARHVHLSLDHGKTWKKIFDLNEFLISRGQTTLLRHIHGVAWDPYWDRIWLSFGDSMGGNGSNGVIYSDDLGATWEVAYHSAEVDTPEGWQVVGIQPMKNCVLFAGDMTPAGVMRLDRAGGKHREKWEFVEAWNYGESHKLLCHAIRHHETGRTETTLFGFSREGTASPSIIVGTHDGIQWNLIWESSDNASPGFRFMAGPTLTGELIAAINRSGTWTELRGKVDAY